MTFTTVRDPQTGNTYYAQLDHPVTIGWFNDGDPATQIMLWYNRTTRDWVVSFANARGWQVGSSQYVYSREDAELIALDMLNAALADDRSELQLWY